MDKPRIYDDLNEMAADAFDTSESDLKFLRLLSVEIKKHSDDLHILRKCLINFKNQGMDKDTMLKDMEKLRTESDFRTEEVLLELMDFVSGWCNSSLSIFEETDSGLYEH